MTRSGFCLVSAVGRVEREENSGGLVCGADVLRRPTGRATWLSTSSSATLGHKWGSSWGALPCPLPGLRGTFAIGRMPRGDAFVGGYATD